MNSIKYTPIKFNNLSTVILLVRELRCDHP